MVGFNQVGGWWGRGNSHWWSCTINLSWTNDNWIVRDYQHMVKMERIFLFLFQAAWYEGSFFFFIVLVFSRLLIAILCWYRSFFSMIIYLFFLFFFSFYKSLARIRRHLNDNFKMVLLIFLIAALAIARIAIYIT